MSTVETNAATRDTIRSFILDQFPLARQKNLTDDDSLLHDGLIDSMGTLDVVMFLEETFDIVLEDEDLVMDNFATVSTLAEFVESKLPS
ncbi:MAG: acyl carrier protein [Fuerstiella sp.]|nr:acyl carrier protein [Fuerstiella sp.]MCP4854420.1 acyl carrier protein [Fuerstiella sp.]